MKSPGLAAFLSFLISGLGQVYNGQVGKGLLFFVLECVSVALIWVVVGFVTTPIIWIWSMVDAYKTANYLNSLQNTTTM